MQILFKMAQFWMPFNNLRLYNTMTELPDNILHLPQYQVLGCKSTDDEMHFQVDVPDPIACEWRSMKALMDEASEAKPSCANNSENR
jgi:hypothetical protein